MENHPPMTVLFTSRVESEGGHCFCPTKQPHFCGNPHCLAEIPCRNHLVVLINRCNPLFLTASSPALPQPHPQRVTLFETSRAAPRSTVAAAHNPRARHRHRNPKSPEIGGKCNSSASNEKWKMIGKKDKKKRRVSCYLCTGMMYDIALSTRWALQHKLRRPC